MALSPPASKPAGCEVCGSLGKSSWERREIRKDGICRKCAPIRHKAQRPVRLCCWGPLRRKQSLSAATRRLIGPVRR